MNRAMYEICWLLQSCSVLCFMSCSLVNSSIICSPRFLSRQFKNLKAFIPFHQRDHFCLSLLELRFLEMSLFSRSSLDPVSSSKRNAGPDRSEVGFERLSTFDVRFSIILKISLTKLSISQSLG